ncbi:MAG: hypothetical protein U0836_17685 [Pirellulales bacterium]
MPTADARKQAWSQPQSIAEVLPTIPATAWRRLTVAVGGQGPRVYEYAELTVWFSEGSPTTEPERLLVRRSLGQEAEIKVQRSNAPLSVPLSKLAQVGGCRWTIEEDFQCGKASAASMSMKPAAGAGGTTTRCSRCWPCGSWRLQKQRLGKKSRR